MAKATKSLAQLRAEANKANVLFFNLTNVKEAKGGRPQTVVFDGETVKPNGSIITLGDTQESKGRELDHVHEAKFEETTDFIGKFVIASPEINVEQYRYLDNMAWKYALNPHETYTAYELGKYDRLEYSEAYFADIEGLSVGDEVKLNAAGKFEKESDAGLRVVTILDLNRPIVLEANQAAKQGAKFMPRLGKMIKVEVVK